MAKLAIELNDTDYRDPQLDSDPGIFSAEENSTLSCSSVIVRSVLAPIGPRLSLPVAPAAREFFKEIQPRPSPTDQ